MQFDHLEISKVLPHRYPFLLVDRILEVEAGKRITGIKNVTWNEPHFVGHFPDQPIMPGVLIIEALAQIAAVLVLHDKGLDGELPLFAGMDRVKFRRQVVPGDQLKLAAEVIKMRGPFGQVAAKATVEGELAAEGTIKFMIPAIKAKKESVG